METLNTTDLILRLKEVKRQRNLTIPIIRQTLESAGEYVSETTLRRVFAEDSETNDSFAYDRTLLPIAKALLFTADNEDDASIRAENEGLKALVLVKTEKIQDLTDQITKMRTHIEQLKVDSEKRTAFLLAQIAKKDERMDRKDAIIQQLLEKVL